ncbi:hypothetical protein BU23DRAFT_658635 [Bimuria novae-zelandiae CBS 107.79]|uniref:Uncharacterized protein n=1 Tax=Bimuria novae-zelandiae CBS 107.79 TaxID=1447943 RepID=A0A6A5V327_9PLEO|nr:hypothetical protein BU23DRAFT_658635 [Bimuria novae-zelandiae CBS 107.79]
MALNTEFTAEFLEQGAEVIEDVEMMDPQSDDGAQTNDWENQYTQSQWAAVSVPMEEVVKPYVPDPRYALNAVNVSLQADMATRDPLLVDYSVDTRVGTVLMFISRILGPKKWPAYKQTAILLLESEHEFTHGAVGYLHNDLARQLNGRWSDVFPILEGLSRAGGLHRIANEQAGVLKRIAMDWYREFYIDRDRMPRTRHKRNATVADRLDERAHKDRMCRESMGFLQNWNGIFPEDIDSLLAAMKTTSI